MHRFALVRCNRFGKFQWYYIELVVTIEKVSIGIYFGLKCCDQLLLEILVIALKKEGIKADR